MPTQNTRQVGGDHYKKEGTALQHWDVVHQLGWDYFQGNITKYVDRHRRKKGFEDLQKAEHYLQKYMEVEYPKEYAAREEAKLKPLDHWTAKELMDELRRRAHEEERLAMEEHLGGAPPGTVCKECGHEDGVHSLECTLGGYAPPLGSVT